jgi:serine/threonine-protein kinase
LSGGPEAPPAPLVRSILKLPVDATLQPLATGIPVTLSPDGTIVVYAGRQQLFVRWLDQLDPVPLPNSRGGEQPFFSPDGQRIGFVADGNPGTRLGRRSGAHARSGRGLFGRQLGAPGDDRLLAAGKLFQVPASGGTPRGSDAGGSGGPGTLRWPDFLPDGKRSSPPPERCPHLHGDRELETGG